MEIREAQRTCFCRGCSKSIEKGERIFHTRSSLGASKLYQIIFCMDCVEKIRELKEETQ